MNILMFLAETDITDYNMKMGELLGQAIMVLLIVAVIGGFINSKIKKNKAAKNERRR